MDNRITKSRLKQLLSYDLIKIIAIIVAGVLVWSLMFTMFGDSLSEGQSLNVYSYGVNISSGEMDKFMKDGEYCDYTSYDVHETTFYSFVNEEVFYQQYAAWSSVGQLDVFFISSVKNIEDGTEKNEAGEEVKKYTSLFENYAAQRAFIDLNSLAASAIEYCTVHGYSEDGSVDEQKIKDYFYKRKKGDNFLRHKLIDADMEVERFALIWKYANTLTAWLSDESIDIWAYAAPIEQGGKEWRAGIDMGKLDNYKREDGKMAVELCSPMYKEPSDTSASSSSAEGGESEKVSSANGVVLTVMDNKGFQEDLMYESLAFVVKVVSTYTNLQVL